ncbi:TonB family protein [Methyloceanibacter stevinii]|uniref:TonB family protein n=1 Tax=Methyloceanibacter stevinii TaxID=1774970 RepID=UPI00130127AA|nr:TonB family protein [Methyloceanibacter stevinii]
MAKGNPVPPQPVQALPRGRARPRRSGCNQGRVQDRAAGKLVDARLIRGSGSEPLDEEALAVLRRASPFPEPPDRQPGEQVHLVLPIEFLIRR